MGWAQLALLFAFMFWLTLAKAQHHSRAKVQVVLVVIDAVVDGGDMIISGKSSVSVRGRRAKRTARMRNAQQQLAEELPRGAM